jgi:peptidoglycan/xylan/chitin deacetylase (PgdA/CDA1 family)
MQSAQPLTLPHEDDYRTDAAAPALRVSDAPALPVDPWSRRVSRAHWTAGVAFVLAFALALVKPPLAAVPLSAFVLLCLTAPPFPRWSFFLPIFSRGPRSLGAVTLTFDDGPDPASTRPLLDLLARHGVKAAFFVVGEQAEEHPDLIREILARGHEIGNHSHTHDLFLMLRSSATLRREISFCQEALGRQGVRPLVFRPPLGITNPRLPGALRKIGLTAVCFGCRPLDFGNRRVRGLARRVLREVGSGDVVLLHDRAPSAGLEPWLQEIEAILVGLRARGIGVAPLASLLGRPVMDRAEAPGPRPPLPNIT